MDDVERGEKPAKDYCTFREAQTVLGKKYRGSIENCLKNGSLRFYPASPKHGKARLIYRPDVWALRDKKKKNTAK